MKSALKVLHGLDWVVAVGTLAYGLWQSSTLFVVLGALGLILAWVNPAKKMSERIMKRTTATKRRQIQDEAAAKEAIAAAAATEAGSAAYSHEADHSTASPALPAPTLPSLLSQAHLVRYAGLRLHPTVHNRLKPESFNLYVRSSAPKPEFH